MHCYIHVYAYQELHITKDIVTPKGGACNFDYMLIFSEILGFEALYSVFYLNHNYIHRDLPRRSSSLYMPLILFTYM